MTHPLNDLVDGRVGLFEVLGEDLLLGLERRRIAAPLGLQCLWAGARNWGSAAAGELAQRRPAGIAEGGHGCEGSDGDMEIWKRKQGAPKHFIGRAASNGQLTSRRWT
jgi:hypothetical protein